MKRHIDILLTALAPAIWGSSYIVTTELLPDGYPVTVSALRALPAGLLLLLLVRQLPTGLWWGRIFILGALNFSIFWALMFLAAYKLPGGVAAAIGTIQPLMVIFLAKVALGTAIRLLSIIAAVTGILGFSILLLTPDVSLDPLGIAAGFGGALSMAAGVVLTRKWQPPVSLLTFTAWQLTAGGILLIPMAMIIEPPLPVLTANNILGLAYLSLIGAALTYIIWFRGIARLDPFSVSILGFFTPLSAVLLGWFVLDQMLSHLQVIGVIIILISIVLSQSNSTSQNSFKTER